MERKLPRWQLQTAKAQFSEVFRRARAEGPQIITRQGKEAVAVIPLEQFDSLLARGRRPRSIAQFLRESPLAGLNLPLERNRDTGRKIDL